MVLIGVVFLLLASIIISKFLNNLRKDKIKVQVKIIRHGKMCINPYADKKEAFELRTSDQLFKFGGSYS